MDVTFFDRDAVLYAVSERHLNSRALYFNRIRERVLDFNFEPDPNFLENAIRALRYTHRWDAATGTGLSEHVAD